MVSGSRSTIRFSIKGYELPEEAIVSLRKEVDMLVSEAINGGLVDGFSDGSFLDVLIGARCNQIRNALKKMQASRKMDFLSLQDTVRDEIKYIRTKSDIARKEIDRIRML